MSGRTSPLGLAAYVLLPLALLLGSELIRAVTPSHMHQLLLLALGGIVLICFAYLRVNAAIRAKEPQTSAPVQGTSSDAASERPDFKRKHWIVVAVTTTLLLIIWTALINMGQTIDDAAVRPMVLIVLPFATAMIVTGSIQFLGPFRRKEGDAIRFIGILPLAVLVALAFAGILLVPSWAILTFTGRFDMGQDGQALHPVFLMLPLAFAAFKLFWSSKV